MSGGSEVERGETRVRGDGANSQALRCSPLPASQEVPEADRAARTGSVGKRRQSTILGATSGTVLGIRIMTMLLWYEDGILDTIPSEEPLLGNISPTRSPRTREDKMTAKPLFSLTTTTLSFTRTSKYHNFKAMLSDENVTSLLIVPSPVRHVGWAGPRRPPPACLPACLHRPAHPQPHTPPQNTYKEVAQNMFSITLQPSAIGHA
ncbi:hypothetical protein O3P69_001628 [Scylla paramamosain]|uniref:Uncharacterized protein n=1 Tax=Scylla paramamosain TaxID=85552 RepID=A0AAW0V118_SCYPA